MKNILLSVLLFCFSMGSFAKDGKPSGVTFKVDSNLTPPEALKVMPFSKIAPRLYKIASKTETEPKIIKISNPEDNLFYSGTDPFLKMMLMAYSGHHPISLSPDAMWLLISQQFSFYVNNNSELLRTKLVDFDGKQSLVVESKYPHDSNKNNWPELIDGLSRKIIQNSKGDYAKTMISDFTTTDQESLVASQATLMKSMENYFEYIVIYAACGIPSITLEGTPDDWQKVIDKTKCLEKYGLKEWVGEITPLLQEFVNASKGKINDRFWKNIMIKNRPDKISRGGCSSEKPTIFDGWFTKFFLYDELGKIHKSISLNSTALPELSRVNIKFKELNPKTGEITEIPMELVAGIIGIEQQEKTLMLSPKIGWMIVESTGSSEIVQNMKKQSENFGLQLRVNKIPEELRELGYIKKLHLDFIGDVEIPDWFYNLKIGDLTVTSVTNKKTKELLRKHFPNVRIR